MGCERLLKLNSEDFIDNGLTVAEMLRLADLFAQTGIDAIELSGGTTDPNGDQFPVRKGSPLRERDEVYYREAARRFREQIDVPLILVGGIRSYEVAKGLIDERFADYIALCRPLIREPHLIARWKSGDTRKSQCDSCVQPAESRRLRPAKGPPRHAVSASCDPAIDVACNCDNSRSSL